MRGSWHAFLAVLETATQPHTVNEIEDQIWARGGLWSSSRISTAAGELLGQGFVCLDAVDGVSRYSRRARRYSITDAGRELLGRTARE